MTESNAEGASDATPIASRPVHLTDQQPAIAVVPVAAKTSHTRTILEIVGGVVAVGLILFSGAAGFVLGHVTAKHDGRGDGGRMMLRIDRPDGGGRILERGQDSQGGPMFRGGPGLMLPGQGVAPTVPQG